ncbi:NAD(P)/FAD-dependent oxidoreductase [Dactylosporangium sp. NPDC049525]|uniref:NAD(P)/FAD-dependent oxidoreductase n=1 Tax=Dactylosporangium sp. NPDC049525 TaxID=3154730 RepID=UPI00341B201D
MNDSDQRPDSVDVVIIGAGPGGTSAASALAQAGRSVLVLERRELPRFHIGESMLPYTMALMDRLKATDLIREQGYVVKRGAEFIFPDGNFRRIDFSDQGPGRVPETIQVERAHFDNLLAGHARSSGATVLEQANVQELVFEGDRIVGVRYEMDGTVRTVRAKYVIDASGRSSKIAQHYRLRKPVKSLQNVAVFRHYTGLDERYNPGFEGDIQVGGHPEGWLWAIPIWSDTISVGAVMARTVLSQRKPDEVFAEHLARSPRVEQRLTGAQPISEVRVETDYCYYSDTLAGPGWFLVGDSGCFFDPIFSGGFFVATLTGVKAAEAVDRLLSEPDREPVVQDEFERMCKTGLDTYLRIIHAYYESQFNLGRYLRGLGADVAGSPFVRLLSGDFWSVANPLGQLLRENPRWDTFAPFERLYGCPVYPELDAAETAALQNS